MGRSLADVEQQAATIDELLSDAFYSLPGAVKDTQRAADRLAAWCRASAAGNWDLFARRLARDDLTIQFVLSRFSTVRRNIAAPVPRWVVDSAWILNALKLEPDIGLVAKLANGAAPLAFEPLLIAAVHAAEKELLSCLPQDDRSFLWHEAVTHLGRALLSQLSQLCAPAMYGCFAALCGAKSAEATNDDAFLLFVSHMRESGFDELFMAKPVLLRLVASVTRQWIESAGEFISRLAEDLPQICAELLGMSGVAPVASVVGGLSDLHNFGRSVLLIDFGEGRRVIYKPKDLRLDAFWHELISWLNCNGPPVDLRSAKVLVRERYGWTECIERAQCADRNEAESYYQRAGALLALFHVFAGADMHLENIIAAGAYPVPIDLEMILQATERENGVGIPERSALEQARRRIADSITAVGFLPAYARTPENAIVGLGGLDGARTDATESYWEFINTDRMRPAQRLRRKEALPNIPTLRGADAPLRNNVGPLISGFSAYAGFLAKKKDQILGCWFFETLRAVSVRRLIKPTRFYSFLSERLRDHRNMDDGAMWSTHLEFIARLSDWDEPHDRLWPLFRAERDALSVLNIPHFVALSDGLEIADYRGIAVRDRDQSGLERVRNRLQTFDMADADWQTRILDISTAAIARKAENARGEPRLLECTGEYADVNLARQRLVAGAADVAKCIAHLAIRRGPGAAWIGLDWLGDSEVSQLVPLGFDLYNGAPGISLFLAAYSHTMHDSSAAELSLAGLSPLRSYVQGANAARTARSLGVGGATGIASVVYALTAIGGLLKEEALLADAVAAARLMTHELIAADRNFDIIGGSAGAILSLLNLYRRTGDTDVLNRAVNCGQHLISNRPHDSENLRVWSGLGGASRPLTGMSHGAAGFAYAMAAIHSATGREEFARAAEECITFENRFYSSAHANWPDLREGVGAPRSWPCQWCYGAGGIGLARIATSRYWHGEATLLVTDVVNAVSCAKQAWPSAVDTLCCGNLGNIEFLYEAAGFLEDQDLRSLALRRLLAVVDEAGIVGDYRWDCGEQRFNLGFFRGLAGVGYTLLRQLCSGIPNVLIWE
jgi:type 2 lantibiotic biosynthesis protein LanM